MTKQGSRRSAGEDDHRTAHPLDDCLPTMAVQAGQDPDTEEGRRAFEQLAIILARPGHRIARVELEILPVTKLARSCAQRFARQNTAA